MEHAVERVLRDQLPPRHLQPLRFLLDQLPSQLDGAVLLLGVQPVPDLVPRPRGHDHVDPLAARRLRRPGDDVDDVAVRQRRPQRHELPVQPRADAAVADVGVDPVGEVERRRAAREGEDVAFRREGVDLVGVEVDLQRVHEDPRVGDVLLPLHELPQPEEAGVVGRRADAPLLVLPVRGDALLGDEVHLLRADLHLERLPLLRHHGRVQRLVEVRLRHRDVVFDASGDRPPGLVDDAEGRVAVLDRGSDDAEGEVVVELADVDALTAQLLPDRVHRLHAAVHVAGDLVVAELPGDRLLHPVDELARQGDPLADRALQLLRLARMEVVEGEVFELALQAPHAEAVGDRRVDLHRLLGDGNALLLGQELQRAHVVEPVGQLDQDDAEVADHGQEHLAKRLGLLLFLRDVGVTGDLGDAVDELGDVVAEHLLQRLLRGERVLEDVVEQPDGDGGLVEAHLREDVRDLEGVDQVRLARAADLPAMLPRREDVGPLQQLLVEVRLIALDLLEDLFEADHGRLTVA